MLAALSEPIRRKAVEKFRLFLADPNHPLLHNHPLIDGGRGQHRNGSRSVWINREYRAIYIIESGMNVWYWIGSHSAYNILTGRNG